MGDGPLSLMTAHMLQIAPCERVNAGRSDGSIRDSACRGKKAANLTLRLDSRVF